MRLFLNGVPVGEGTVIPLDEVDKLRLVVDDCIRAPMVSVGDEPVPLRADGYFRWIADEAWVEAAAATHLVGDCDLLAVDPEGQAVRAIVRRQASRITEAQHRFMIEELRRRLGSVADPLGRSRIWASIAPRVPAAAEERALLLLQCFERAAPALRSVAARPLPSLTREEDWRPVSRLAGVRGADIDVRRFRPATAPWPIPRPTHGEIPLRRSAERHDTPENRYAISVVRRLSNAMLAALDDQIGPSTLRGLGHAATELDSWFGSDFWQRLPDGGAPYQSFILRDHPGYHVIAWLGSALGHLAGTTLGVPPALSEAAIPITPWSLNVLYERWIQCLVREWLEKRLGALRDPLDFTRAFVWRQGQMRIVLRLDVPYPRRGRELVAPEGKNRPDVAIELWSSAGEVKVAVLDVTYSRSRRLHEEKAGYVRTIRNGSQRDPLTNAPRLATRWAAVAFPGAHAGAEEIIGSGVQMFLSVPPSGEGSDLLHRWLDRTIGPEL